LPLIQNNCWAHYKDIQAANSADNDLKDRGTLQAINLSLLLYPQKILKTLAEGIKNNKYAEYLRGIKHDTLIVNDLLFNFTISRLKR